MCLVVLLIFGCLFDFTWAAALSVLDGDSCEVDSRELRACLLHVLILLFGDFIVFCIHTSRADADQRLGASIFVAPVRFPYSAYSRYPTY